MSAYQTVQRADGRWEIIETEENVCIEIMGYDKFAAVCWVGVLNRNARGLPFLNIRHVLVSHWNGEEVEGWIIADADVDGTFLLIEDDTGERLKVNGWNATTVDSGP